ncbi:MAG: hypothetical protein AB7J35_04100 [Dehalococcoidia bacterium]
MTCNCHYPPPCPAHEIQPWAPGDPLPQPYDGPPFDSYVRIVEGRETVDMRGYAFALSADVRLGRLNPRAVTSHIREMASLVNIAGPRRDRKRDAWEAAQLGNALHQLPPETKAGWEYLESQMAEADLFTLSILAAPQFRRPKPENWPEELTRPMAEHLPVGVNAHARQVFEERLRIAQQEWDAAHPSLPRIESSAEYEPLAYGTQSREKPRSSFPQSDSP